MALHVYAQINTVKVTPSEMLDDFKIPGPVGLTARTSIGNASYLYSVALKWRGNRDVDGFIIERKSTSRNEPWMVIASIGNVQDYLDYIFVDQIAYLYRVQAFKTPLISNYSNQIKVILHPLYLLR